MPVQPSRPVPLAPPVPVAVQCADALVARGITSVLAQEADLSLVDADAPQDLAVRVLVTDFEAAMAQVRTVQGKRLATAPPRLLVYSPVRREHEIRQALAAGIPGFLGQGFALSELPLAVRTLDRGGRYYDLATTQRAAISLASETLTGREMEVLGLIVQGACNKTIAARLQVTLGTVKAHVGAILSKLQVSSRTQAMRVAVSRGLVDSPWDGGDIDLRTTAPRGYAPAAATHRPAWHS